MRKKRNLYLLVLTIGGSLWTGCEQKLQFDFDKQTPIPVINSILKTGDDSVRVRVTWTKNVYEQGDFPVETHALVKLYKNNSLVGECNYLKNGWYSLAHKVEASETYRVEASIEGQSLIWGETRVPAPLLQASIEYDSLQNRVINRWTDRKEEKNYYWLSAARSSNNGGMDTLRMELQGAISTNSTLPDAFNRSFDFDEEIPAEYDYYLRVEDSGLAGEDIELVYKGNRMNYYWEPDTGCYKSVHFILSLDECYDRYLKSSVMNEEYAMDMDSEPLFYAPLWTYSNIHGGTGLVASYSKYEDVFVKVFHKQEGEQ